MVMLYVIAFLCCVIIVILLRISQAMKKKIYFQASYNASDAFVTYTCETCRFWQPSELLPHNSKDSGECLRSPEAWLLQHVVIRLNKILNIDPPKGGYFDKKFTCGMYEQKENIK